MKLSIDPASLTPLISVVFKCWTASLRYELHGDIQPIIDENKQGKPYIAALWHEDLFSVIGFANTVSRNYVGVVSPSKDGEVIARVLEGFGHKTVRGSSSRGGVKALLQAKRIMEAEKRMAVFAVDGPRGPRHSAKEGILFLSQRAKAPIIPIRAFPQSKKIFEKAWDKFQLPRPFTRCPIYVGELFEVTSEKLNKDVMAQEKRRLEKCLLGLGPDK